MELVILLPDPRTLRVIARSVLLAAALLSLPWFRAMHVHSGDGSAPAVDPDEADPKWADGPLAVRMLVADLKREGLFNPGLRNVFIGDPSLLVNGLDLMREYKKSFVGDNSVDFVLAADGLGDPDLGFVDRVLKVGGIVVVRLASDPNRLFRLPSNYRMLYIRRFGATFVAIKKISHGNADEFGGGLRGRRLLSAAKLKKKQRKKAMYLIRVLVTSGSSDEQLIEISYGARAGEFEVVVVASSGGGLKERFAKWLEMKMKGIVGGFWGV
ncbi:uncharacterized protein A4U43_C03F3790 [Asparagus officinalis]|uniref:Uncharacterized protein n=1 Tax=Asparagus officinalis TaxID=4686 RepID=A0A5P1F742_ASPOF|nr:uncharacterized protein LOC109832841 [Asparagus officinalis]ONK74196.1 uncharacterized protein A4U43_C03F3790 [Asparagus officinalis]